MSKEQLYMEAKIAAERCARRHLEVFDARNKTYAGHGTVRNLAPGTTFVFTEHAIHDADRAAQGDAAATFAVVRVEHHARNNLSSDARTLLDRLFAGHVDQAAPADDEPLYANRFTALRADLPWRPLDADGRGMLLHPKPTWSASPARTCASSATTASRCNCTGSAARSQSRQPHPHGDNAPGDAGAYIWVRAGQGLLISTDARPNAGSTQMDAREAYAQLQQAQRAQLKAAAHR